MINIVQARSVNVPGSLPGNTGKQGKRKKPGRTSRPIAIKYGIKIPRNVKEAYAFDAEAGNTLWADAIKAEVKSLLMMNCFEFLDPGYQPPRDYQSTSLNMIFEVKHDGRRKARLVAGGHIVALQNLSAWSTVVKAVRVRLLDIISHRDNLNVLCDDIGNAFVTAPCLEKVCSVAGPEFGQQEGAVVIIRKALYGLKSSSRAFRMFFAKFLKGCGFISTRYDRDIWMCLREKRDGYDYICTHVDDFKVVARDPKHWMDLIENKFVLKSVGPPSYYLGTDYNWSTNKMNADDLRIQRTDPNENNEYFDYDSIRLEGDDVSATLCMVY